MDLAPGHKFKIAIAKQSLEGTPAANPEYTIPAFSGGLAPLQQRRRHEVADGQLYRPGGYISEAHVGGRLELGCFPNSLPRLVAGHLGSDTVSGSADPWSHAMVLNALQPWHTVWVARPKPDGTFHWDRFHDCLFQTCEIAFANGVPVRCGLDILGKKATGALSVAPSGGVENKYNNQESYFNAVDSTLKVDIDATPAATTVHNIQTFTVKMGFDSMELVQTDELTPRYRDAGLWNIGFSADTVLESYAHYLATFYGSKTAADAGLSATIVRGSIDFTMPVAPVADVNRTLRIQIPAVEFSATPPEIDPSGKGLRSNVTAELQQPASGEPVTVTVKNAVSTGY